VYGGDEPEIKFGRLPNNVQTSLYWGDLWEANSETDRVVGLFYLKERMFMEFE